MYIWASIIYTLGVITMKKMLKLLSAMAVLVCGLMLAGCMLNDDEKEVLGPNNVWCEFRNASDNNENETDATKKGKYYFKYVDATKTFSIAFFPNDETLIGKFSEAAGGNGKKGYYFKEFVNGSNVDASEDDTIKLAYKMSQSKWIGLYHFYLKKATFPTNADKINIDSTIAEIQEFKSNFTLKNVLQTIVNCL